MVKRILLLSAFGASLIIAVSALLTNYLQQQRLPYRESYTAPCEQDVAAFCASLQTIFSCGALLRGAGGVALVVGVTLGALAILRMTHRRWIVAGFATVAFLTGIGGLWLSQQAREAYYQLSLFPHSYPPQYFQARLAMIASMSRFYTAWRFGTRMHSLLGRSSQLRRHRVQQGRATDAEQCPLLSRPCGQQYVSCVCSHVADALVMSGDRRKMATPGR